MLLQRPDHLFWLDRNSEPFDHCVVDNFLLPDVAREVAAEFLHYDDPRWLYYDTVVENKKTCDNWRVFPPATYQLLSYLCSADWCDHLGRMLRVNIKPDPGLHGGGWHAHGSGGNLNPHLDYSIHPKLKLQRKLNIIIYLTPMYQESWGGHLGLWSDRNGEPGELVKEVAPLFNRAVIFDTTQMSWHGMSRRLALPPDKQRKSLAVYYLCKPAHDVDKRGRALFAPRVEQRGDAGVAHFIQERSK